APAANAPTMTTIAIAALNHGLRATPASQDMRASLSIADFVAIADKTSQRPACEDCYRTVSMPKNREKWQQLGPAFAAIAHQDVASRYMTRD
ncbi:MAG: hypothetical protein Q8M24_25015, partial [Pseudolabrys sp.]|nr:hypothetical protein [Pseudolabrys sp.]